LAAITPLPNRSPPSTATTASHRPRSTTARAAPSLHKLTCRRARRPDAGRRFGKPLEPRRSHARRKISPPPNRPTAPIKGRHPLLAAPHPSRKPPAVPICITAALIALPPPASATAQTTPRSRLPEQPQPKVSMGVRSPRYPLRFPLSPVAADPWMPPPAVSRGRPCLPPLFLIGGGRRAFLPKAPWIFLLFWVPL
jgi:hypothetical protein